MYRIIAALFLVVAFAAAASAQAVFPSAWQSQSGAILKILTVDPAGNISGVFLSNPSGPCPAVPYNMAGTVRGPRIAFQTSRTWTPDCSVTAVWIGRFVSPTTTAVKWRITSGPGGPAKRGTEVFQR